jgi:hypothetical protein
LQYIDRAKDGSQVMREAEYAWLRLKQAITNPTPLDVVALGVGARSVDFGRSEVVQVLNQSDTAEITGKLMSVKAQLWREGAIAREFPRLKPALLRALEMAHVVRGVSARLNR